MNVEIKGLPVVAKEDLTSSVRGIATCFGTKVSESDIEVAHRVQSRNKKTPNVVVTFASRGVRDRLLSAAKKTRLNTTHLGFYIQLYINEHICVENKVLLNKARLAKREKNWKYVWVSQGKVLMRKTENSPVLQITCEGDLIRMV